MGGGGLGWAVGGAERSLCLHLVVAERTCIARCKPPHPRQGAKGEETCTDAKETRTWKDWKAGRGKGDATEVLGLDHGILSLLQREGKAVCQIRLLDGARKKYLTHCV